jgi:hypothetical protein
VSSAYYALFHCIARQAASHLLPDAAPEQQLRLARSFDHRPIKNVCEWVASRGEPPEHATQLVQSLRRDAAMAGVAAAFCDLQEARHSADYDHLEPFAKAAVVGHIQDAEQAIQKLAAQSDGNRQTFFSLISLKTSLR